jgi:uncharacterized membrane protein
MKVVCGPVFVGAGLMHFLKPHWYRRIMPPYVPAPETMVAISGAAEIAGGVGLMAPSSRVRTAAGWWLAATLVAVFPANLHMALNADDYRGVPGGRPALYARLPFQLVFISWVLAAARR